MYIKKSSGYVVGFQGLGDAVRENTADNAPYRVVKQGRVLRLNEETQSPLTKASDLDTFVNQGYVYYQIVTNSGACETCEAHSGAIYPIAGAKEGVNLPPFHPNCVCFAQQFSKENPNHDPWLGEIASWLEIVYESGSLEEQAKKILDVFQWTDISSEEIELALSGTAHILNIGKRIPAFYEMLDRGFEKEIVEGWLALYSAPTAYGEGRVVEMPDIEGFHPANWYAFEGLDDINPYARDVIGEDNAHVNVGENDEVTDDGGRYWIAVGPNVMNPKHQPSEGISLEEMQYGTKIDVVLRDDEGNLYYLPCVVGDVKAHTWPNGILQTGNAFPNGVDPHPYPRVDAPIEFIGAVLPSGLSDYEIVNIIVYD